jgi:hypothetical protein
MIDKRFLHGSVLLFVGFLIGLSASSLSCGPVPVEGLTFVEGVVSGHSANDSSTEVYSYNLTFYNSGNKDIYVNTIDPVLSSDSRILSTQQSLISEIERYVPAGSLVSIKGSILINSENSTKEEIIGIELIKCINMTSTETIHCFNYPPE